MKRTGTMFIAAVASAVAILASVAPAHGGPDIGSALDTSASRSLGFGTGSQPPTVALDAAPQRVKDEVARVRGQGFEILAIAQDDYEPVVSGPGIQAYPSGCGLWVIVYRSNNDYVANSSLTECVSAVSEMEMFGGLARWRGFWWQQVASGGDDADNTTSLVIYVSWFCRGSGLYTYQGSTNGVVVRGGTVYRASAWDQLDNERC